jgi:hypothetical protein
VCPSSSSSSTSSQCSNTRYTTLSHLSLCVVVMPSLVIFRLEKKVLPAILFCVTLAKFSGVEFDGSAHRQEEIAGRSTPRQKSDIYPLVCAAAALCVCVCLNY